MVSELFAGARGLHPGGEISAVLEGHEVRLRIVGVAASPEYVISTNPRTGFPDPAHFGIFWMDGPALAHALGLYGAFNDAVLSFAARAQPEEIVAALDRLLEPYGGAGAVLRERHPSTLLLNAKIDQYKSMAKVVPLFFLAIAAFLLNMVLSRIVGAQREQIATLKALGYTAGALALHYLMFALVVCALGAVLGILLGVLEGEGGLHALLRFFNLPALVYQPGLDAAALGVLISLGRRAPGRADRRAQDAAAAGGGGDAARAAGELRAHAARAAARRIGCWGRWGGWCCAILGGGRGGSSSRRWRWRWRPRSCWWAPR